MIRLWLLVLLALAVGAATAYFLRVETGYVLMSYGDWVVETSLLGLVAALVLGFLLLFYGFKLLLTGLRLPQIVRGAIDRRRAERARDSFEAGLLQLLEGHWKRAEVELVRRAADHHASHLNYLAAARAAQRLEAADRRDHYLALAAQSSPENEFATLLTQAELQRERGEFALTRETALKLRAHDPKHPYAIELLAESYAALAQWEPLRALLSETAKLKALPPTRARALMIQALHALIGEAVQDSALPRLKAIWEAAGSVYRNEPEVRRDYARGLARLNADAEAAALIGSALKQDWDGELVWLFGELHAADPLGQLATIEQWLNQYGEKPELLVTAGRACLANKLWGKARSYLEAVARLNPTPAAYLELARLCEQTQNPDEANKFFRHGLELAAGAIRA